MSKSEQVREKRDPWYAQFDGPETLREAYDALVAGIERADPDAAAVALRALGRLVKDQEDAVRESAWFAEYAEDAFPEGGARLRQTADGYGDQIEGAGRMPGSFTHNHAGSGLLERMGIADELNF